MTAAAVSKDFIPTRTRSTLIVSGLRFQSKVCLSGCLEGFRRHQVCGVMVEQCLTDWFKINSDIRR